MAIEHLGIKTFAGTEADVATDLVGTDNYQVVKIGLGADGALDNLLDAGPQAGAASLPVALSNEDNAVLDAIALAVATEGDALGDGILLQGDDGTDRTNVLVDTDGHLQVDVLSNPSQAVTNTGTFAVQAAQGTAANLNMTEASASAIKTAVELIDDAVYADDADWTDNSSKHLLVGGVYQSAPHTVTDGDVSPLQVDVNGHVLAKLVAGTASIGKLTDDQKIDLNKVAGASVTVGAGTEATCLRVTLPTDGTGQVKLAASAGVNIGDVYAHQATAADLNCTEASASAIKTAVELLDNAVDGNYLNVNLNLAGTDAPAGNGAAATAQRVTIANDSTGIITAALSATDNSVLDAIAEGVRPATIWTAFHDCAAAHTDIALQAAPGANLSLYVTDYKVTNDATAAITIKLEEDTASAKTQKTAIDYVPKEGGFTVRYATPIKLTANKDLGFTSTGTSNFGVEVHGFTAA